MDKSFILQGRVLRLRHCQRVLGAYADFVALARHKVQGFCLHRALSLKHPHGTANSGAWHQGSGLFFKKCYLVISLSLLCSRRQHCASLAWEEQLQRSPADAQKCPHGVSVSSPEGCSNVWVPHLSNSSDRGRKGALLLHILWVCHQNGSHIPQNTLGKQTRGSLTLTHTADPELAIFSRNWKDAPSCPFLEITWHMPWEHMAKA